MKRLPECDRCQMYGRSSYLVCAIHPNGYHGDSCPDFAVISGLQAEEPWTPEGYSYYGGELILETLSELSWGDRIWLLDNHPLFTGRCPKCGTQFLERPAVHWDCTECDWKDDSV